MTNLQSLIQELESLEKKATPGPWHIGHINESTDSGDIDSAESGTVCENVNRNSEAFICIARNSLPKLLEALKILSEACEHYARGADCPDNDYWSTSVAQDTLQKVEALFEKGLAHHPI